MGKLTQYCLFFLLLQFTSSYAYPSYTLKRNLKRASVDGEVDYSHGFPTGFTEGLPTFDFSRPMTAGSQSEETAAETENVGFVHGPPDGFPTLSQLGVNFPNFDIQGQSSSRKEQLPHHYSPQHDVASSFYHSEERNRYDHASPTSHSSSDNEYRPRPTSQHQKYQADPIRGSGYSHYDKKEDHYVTHPSTKPIVLKVSTKKTRPTKLPPPAPPFYAPSPDLQVASQKAKRPSNHGGDGIKSEAASQNHPYYFAPRYRRDTKAAMMVRNVSDQVSDETDAVYWEVPSPYIVFDTYESEKSKKRGGNETSGDADAGEQRFFPSFPGPNPYLGLRPYIPGRRAPLFPGPIANRVPTRSHSTFGGKYSHSNRGPSGVYPAESHDHIDRYVDNNLLGSGNFEVVRGGTFYADEDAYHSNGFTHSSSPHHHSDDGDYYHHNGHSSGFGSPGTDFFANFRDFADINPHSRSYSHNYEKRVIFEPGPNERQPKNILDKLQSRADIIGENRSGESDPMVATY